MRKFNFLLLFFVLTIILLFSSVNVLSITTPNYIVNETFEDSNNPFTAYEGSVTFTIDTTTVKEGLKSMKIYTAASGYDRWKLDFTQYNDTSKILYISYWMNMGNNIYSGDNMVWINVRNSAPLNAVYSYQRHTNNGYGHFPNSIWVMLGSSTSDVMTGWNKIEADINLSSKKYNLRIYDTSSVLQKTRTNQLFFDNTILNIKDLAWTSTGAAYVAKTVYLDDIKIWYNVITSDISNINIINLSTTQNSTFPVIGDNLTFFFIANSTDTNNISSCIIQTNETGVFTDKNSVFINSSYFSGNISYIINSNMNNNVTWQIECNNTIGLTNTSTTAIFEVKDFTIPTITLNSNNGFDTTNLTIISKALYNLTLNITFFDYNLFQTLVNITCNQSGVIYTDEVLDHNVSSYNLTATIDISGLPLQKCVANLQSSDDHTDNNIPKYKVNKKLKGVEYETDASIISIETDEILNSFKTLKIKDRYSFNFDYKDKKLIRTYHIKSNDTIFYQPTSKYSGHFVIWNNKLKKGNWLDFETTHKYKKYTIEKINNHYYKVIIKVNVPKTKILKARKDGFLGLFGNNLNRNQLEKYYYGLNDVTFNSIGGTNINIANYNFYIGGILNISAINIYDNSAIKNFTFNLTQLDGYPQNNYLINSITNNYIVENLSYGNYTIRFNNSDYFNKSHNISITNSSIIQNYNTYQSIVNFRTKSSVTAAYLNKLNITLNNGGYISNDYSGSATTLTFYVNASTYNYNITRIVYSPIFGNFITNILDNITIIDNMSFISEITLYDEKTLALFNVSHPDSIDFLVFCDDATYISSINTSVFNISVPCDYNKFRVVLYYDLVSYFRTLIIDPNLLGEQENIYLIDLNDTTALSNSFIIEDLLNTYTNPRLIIRKIVNNSQKQINGDYVDVENKVSAFLIENNDYILELYSDNKPVVVLGTYSAFTAGEKNLRLYEINIDYSPIGFINTVSYATGIQNSSPTMYAFASYNDTENETNSVTWNLYQDSVGGTLLFTDTITNEPNINFLYNITSILNTTVIYSELIINHTEGTYIYTKLINEYTKISLGIEQYISQSFLDWFFIIFISIIALMATIGTANYVALFVIGFAALLKAFGWFGISVGILALSFIFVLLSLLHKGDKSE